MKYEVQTGAECRGISLDAGDHQGSGAGGSDNLYFSLRDLLCRVSAGHGPGNSVLFLPGSQVSFTTRLLTVDTATECSRKVAPKPLRIILCCKQPITIIYLCKQTDPSSQECSEIEKINMS